MSAGTGGSIGVMQVAKSPPDGYTLVIASTGFVVNPSLYREPGYDPCKDFLPITELGSSPNVILVHPSSSITSMAQLIDMAKKDKNKLNVINPGRARLHISPRGPAIAALLGKTTPVGITALLPAHAQIKSGALRVFQGMYTPAGTPADIVQRVARDTLDVLNDPVVIGKLRDVGFDVRASGPEGLAARVRKEVPMWHDVIVKSGMELQ